MIHANRLKALKNVLGSWLGLGSTVIAGFALTPYVLHHVGDSAYGIWVLLTAFTGHYGLLDLGLRSATIRYVARHAAVDDAEELNRVVSTSFFFYVGLGLAMVLVTSIVVLLFDRLFKVGPEWRETGRILLLVVGFGTALNMPFTLFSGVLEGLERFSLVGWVQTVSVVARAAVLVFLLQRGYMIVTVGVVTIIANILSALALMFCVFRVAPSLRIRLHNVRFATLRTLGGFGLPIFWISIAQSLRFQFDSMVIGWMISAEAITYFSFGSRLALYSMDVVQMLAQLLTPMASAADATGEHDRQRRLFLMGNRYSAFVALPLGAMFLTAGRTIIRVWVGARYEPMGYAVMAILTVPVTIYLMQAGSPRVLFGMGRHRTLAVILMLESITNLALSIVLARRFGLLGVAWGTAIPLALTNVFFLPFHLCRLLKVRLRDFLIESYFYPVLAVVPGAAALWAADRRIHATNWIGLIGTLAVGGLIYASGLLLYLYFVEHKTGRSPDPQPVLAK
jgi:O-antigen/teichoic acid export membrane protein